jgi:hypothetical protein
MVQDHFSDYRNGESATLKERSLYVWHRIPAPLHTAAPAFVIQIPSELLDRGDATQKAVEWIDPASTGMASTIVFAYTKCDNLILKGWNKILAYHNLGSEHVVIAVKDEPINVEFYKEVLRAGTWKGGHLLTERNPVEDENKARMLFFENCHGIAGCKRFVDVGGLRNLKVT